MSTLLEKAKQQRVNSLRNIPFQEEEIELILAWMAGEVTMSQLSKSSLNITGGAAPYIYIARGIREAFKRGHLTINK